MLAQNAPTGWETWDTRTAVVFITVTLVGALISLVWYLLKEQKEARQSFVAALNSIQDQNRANDAIGEKRHKLLRAAMVKIVRADKQHADTLLAVHNLLKVLTGNQVKDVDKH